VIRSTIFGWRIGSLLVLLAGGIWIWLSAAAPGTVTQGAIPAPREGFLAPDFTLTSSTGHEIHLADLRGKPVLINLWASWCPPCKAEMPAIERVYQNYKGQGLQVIAINTTYQDTRAAADSFAQSEGLTFPIVYDTDGKVSREYQLQALPSTFFIAPNGKIQTVVLGGPMSEALLRSKVEQLLGSAP
jgi:cytochrome c biogenesis protein CcmG/thiol:disulfide interchange protein DsbE